MIGRNPLTKSYYDPLGLSAGSQQRIRESAVDALIKELRSSSTDENRRTILRQYLRKLGVADTELTGNVAV
ncbi:MAG TPA: hypothetical protein VJ276_08985 [Thermoanaerobaculia bacterium]|nr:hypothetical protein [Thermoanaerobaculia bacterium]